MLSSPACELKQYIALDGRRKAFLWADEADAAVDTYVEQQQIERADLEVFKCVQVQCVTASSDLTRDFVTCDFCPDRSYGGKYRNKNLRRHIDAKNSNRRIRCPEGCDHTFSYGRADNVRRHVNKFHR